MAGNSFGEIFRITTFGESHGVALGVVIDGCPAGIEMDTAFLQNELDRRKPGQSSIVTQRKEKKNLKKCLKKYLNYISEKSKKRNAFVMAI